MSLDDRLEAFETVDESPGLVVGGATGDQIPVDRGAVGHLGSERNQPRIVRLIAQGSSPWRDG
jgi:hypothetical protein